MLNPEFRAAWNLLPWNKGKPAHVQRHGGPEGSVSVSSQQGPLFCRCFGRGGAVDTRVPPSLRAERRPVWRYYCRLASEKQWDFWKQEYKLLRHLILPGLVEMWWQVLIWSVIYQPSCSSQEGSPRKAVKGLLIYEQWSHWAKVLAA